MHMSTAHKHYLGLIKLTNQSGLMIFMRSLVCHLYNTKYNERRSLGAFT